MAEGFVETCTKSIADVLRRHASNWEVTMCGWTQEEEENRIIRSNALTILRGRYPLTWINFSEFRHLYQQRLICGCIVMGVGIWELINISVKIHVWFIWTCMCLLVQKIKRTLTVVVVAAVVVYLTIIMFLLLLLLRQVWSCHQWALHSHGLCRCSPDFEQQQQ